MSQSQHPLFLGSQRIILQGVCTSAARHDPMNKEETKTFRSPWLQTTPAPWQSQCCRQTPAQWEMKQLLARSDWQII